LRIASVQFVTRSQYTVGGGVALVALAAGVGLVASLGLASETSGSPVMNLETATT